LNFFGFFPLFHATGIYSCFRAGDILTDILAMQIYPFWVEFFPCFSMENGSHMPDTLVGNGIGVSKLHQNWL